MLSAPVLSLKSLTPARRAPASRVAPRTVASAAAGREVPDMGKRQLMNLLLVGAIGLPGLPLAGGFAYFFVPPS